MKRKAIYAVVGAIVIAVIGGTRLYRSQLTKQDGYLGKEVVYYQDSSEPIAEEEVVTAAPDVTASPAVSEQTASPSPTQAVQDTPVATMMPSPTAAGKYEKILAKEKVQVYESSGTAVVGNAGYELYNYVNSAASRYAKAVNKLTKLVDESVKVYDLIVPTSMGITFPDNRKKKVNSSSQKEALASIEEMLSGRETFVPLYDKLMRHRTEDIYFRTDHHWTSLGAYYAYQAFCEAKGIQPNELSAYHKQKIKGFEGSFYRETKNKNLTPDTMEVLYPLSNKKLSMKYTTTEGQKISAPVIADATKYGKGMKYSAYIAGDNPYTIIHNAQIEDKSSCVVIKESFGNAFVPFLTDHYHTVYVIDYRYWEGRLADFLTKKKIREVLLVNNVSMTRNSYLLGKFMSCLNGAK